MKLTERTELTTGFTDDDLIHLVNDGASYKVKLATALAALATSALPSVNQMVYVTKSGDDTTGNGSLLKPYLTIAKALSVITDATATKLYSIQVGSGFYGEASLALKPWVWIRGEGNSQHGSTRFTVTGNLVTLDASWATGAFNRAGFDNIFASGSTGFDLDLDSLSPAGACVITFDNVGCNGNFTFSGAQLADTLDIYGLRVFGTFNIEGGSALVRGSYIVGVTTVNGTAFNTAVDFLGVEFAANAVNAASTGGGIVMQLIGCSTAAGVSADGAGTTLRVDAISVRDPAQLTVTNGATFISVGLLTQIYHKGTRAGNAVLVGGTKTVAQTSVTANTLILLTRKTAGGTIGMSITYTLNAGVGFTLTSDNVLDTSTYTYLLIENI